MTEETAAPKTHSWEDSLDRTTLLIENTRLKIANVELQINLLQRTRDEQAMLLQQLTAQYTKLCAENAPN